MYLNGGMQDSYGSDSEGQADFAAGFILDGAPYGYSNGASYFGSYSPHMLDADLIVMFGSSMATSRNNGASNMYDLAQVREKGARIIWVDVRQGEESSGQMDEWIPIRPGTDAALAAALVWVFIDEGFAQEDFLHSCCVGYDEETLPESAKGKNSSYKDYILGNGADKTAKTPEWASAITQIPVEKIYELARAIGSAKAAYIGNGVGIQRRSNGENACASVMMIPLVAGQWGLPGTSTGLKPYPGPGAYVPGYQRTENPVKGQFPVTKRIEMIERGSELTALRDGIWDVDRLTQNTKFVCASATNMLANQNSDVNWAASILEDEAKAEFILGCDWFMTASMKYCDVVLPGTMVVEGLNFAAPRGGGSCDSFVFGQKVQDPPFECKSDFEWVSLLAERFGLLEDFTQGTNPEDLARANYEAVTLQAFPDLPPLEEGLAMGFWIKPLTTTPRFSEFRADPANNPLPTPSGKVEIYSERIANIAATWELDDPRDIISPIPIYNPGVESYEDATEEYPLMVSSWKSKIRYHSKFNQNPWLNQACRHQIWINPADAEPRGITSGDTVRVWNDRGEIRIEARVTSRIIPGALALEEGKMRELDANGVDVGACVNTLTTHHWSPLAKHNNSNSILAQIAKL
jgi:DmsA/YnfE family anaerobic dimethyl sulfoxide reductase A subunit